jgi:hypothetical protein
MDRTEFDVLCEGASAEETRRLSKLLAEWCDGDERSFPVQLALLTRAQWRAAATIPHLVDQSRNLLQQEFTEQRRQARALAESLEKSAAAKIGELKVVIDENATKMAKTTSDMRGHLSEADNIARRIRRELEGGAEKWNNTITEFDAATQRLMQLCADLQGRPWRSHWVLVILLLLATFAAGYAIGLHQKH